MNVFAASELFNQPFFIMPDYAVNYYAAWQAYAGSEKHHKADFAQERELRTPMFISGNGETVSGWRHTKAEKDSVAVLRMKGPILKDSQFCGPTGTSDYADLLNQMANNPNIIGCVCRMESGGGAAYAVKPMADAISAFPKPFLVLAEDIMASAAYYIGSYADEIMADNPKSIIGSIGTMIAFQDIRPALEKQGVKFHEIYASQSTAKNKMTNDALKGNYKPITQNWLDPLNEDFISHVKANRAGKLNTDKNEVLNGQTYFASEAQKIGLIDSLGSINDAVSRVRELAKTPKTTRLKQNEANMKFPKLTSLAGKTEISQEELTGVNAELAEAGITGFAIFPEALVSDAAAVTQQLEIAQADVISLTAELQTQTQTAASSESDLLAANNALAASQIQITELNARIEAFGKVGSTNHGPTPGANDVAPDAGEQTAQQLIDELPHNKHADKMLG